MTDTGEGAALYVDTPEALAALMQRIRAQREQEPREKWRCGIDTEADSLHHYDEKLCLIQLVYGTEFALIDPLRQPDLMELLLLLDEGEIWFHGADYDLTLFKRTYGWMPQRMRDTQIASRLAGNRAFGLAALVEKYFGKVLSKSSQKADWSRRPLPQTMLTYAVDDVRYLLPLADLLLGQLDTSGRRTWFLESCASLVQVVTERSAEPREERWRVQGTGRLRPLGLAFVKRMWEWREAIAAEKDSPTFRIISNKQLVELAVDLDAGNDDILPPHGWRPAWKHDFTQILAELLHGDPETFPDRQKKNGKRQTDEAKSQLETLLQKREVLAQQLDLEPGVLASRGDLECVVNEVDGLSALLPWQQAVLAQPLTEARVALGFTQELAS
jgi:ribonuclease D